MKKKTAKKSTRKSVIVPYQVVCSGTRLWDVTREVKVLNKKKCIVKVTETPFEFISDETLAGALARNLNQQLNGN